MAKPFPETIVLKQAKCPRCGEGFHNAALRAADAVVKAICGAPNCDYGLELFWMGDDELYAS